MSENALARIDEIADANLLATAAGGKMSRAIAVADAMTELRGLMNDKLLKNVVGLQGTDIGFRTDRDDKNGYPVDVLRDILIEAVLRGYSPTGNEFNVIAGRFYATRAGLERKVREWPGLTDLKLVEGVPHMMSAGALVEYHAEWYVDGHGDRIDCVCNGASDTRIPVRVNSGMGTDAILGKAKRKMLARIYARLTGSRQSFASMGESEAEPEDLPEAEVVEVTKEEPANSANDANTGEQQTEEQREMAVIACQEAIDICTTPHNVSEALKEFSQGMNTADLDLMAAYAQKKQNELARAKPATK